MTKEEVAKRRIENNIKILKLLESGNCHTSSEEKKLILNDYSGWGGLRDAIYTPAIYKELKSFLSEAKIQSIKD